MKGITFDGKHSSGISGITGVVDYDYPLLPSMDNAFIQLPKGIGVIDAGRAYKERPFKIRLLIDGNSLEDYFLKCFNISSWLNVSEAKPFIFDVLPDRQLFARPTAQIDPSRIAQFGYADVQFTAPDPRFFALQDTSQVVTQGVKQDYNGNEETGLYINVKISQALTYFVINHVESGKLIKLNRSFAANDVIEIDTEQRSVLVNGTDSRAYMDITSRYFKIKGQYSFTTNDSGSILNVRYKSKWI